MLDPYWKRSRLDDDLRRTLEIPFVSKTNHPTANSRSLVLVGGEGTGHHLWSTVLKSCMKSMGRCYEDSVLSQSLWRALRVKSKNRSAIFQIFRSPERAPFPQKLYTSTIDRLRQNAENDKLVVINDLKKDRMLSYPSGGGPMVGSEKIFHYPDVAVLAKMAEEAGSDLRVMVVLREAMACFTTGERKAGYKKPRATELYAATYVHNYRAIVAQLSRIDLQFIRCIEYESLPLIPGDLGTWMGFPNGKKGETLAAQVKKIFRKSTKARKSKATASIPQFWKSAIVAIDADLRALCKRADEARGTGSQELPPI